MRIGFVGCGKLGLMVALTIENRGHEVKGYDISDKPAEYLKSRSIPFQEEFSETLLQDSMMEMVPLHNLCEWADILFLAPQTPHEPLYEGVTPLPETRVDFDYSYLKECVQQVSERLKSPKPCVIISTVLPGTLDFEIKPIISANFQLVYSPQFIAMGTVFRDFLHPEFWLIGADDEQAAGKVLAFFRSISNAPDVVTDIKTAEGIKVLYNVMISTKITYANICGELAHRCEMNVDDIQRAVCYSTTRLLSPKYLSAGMGDGGSCHPRDSIALSYLAKEIGLSFDFFEAIMKAREKHCEFLADVIQDQRMWREASRQKELPVYILGKAFKPETNIETGSPSILLSNILTNRGVKHKILDDLEVMYPALYFIGCKHERYKSYKFPQGSVVIDPFRYLEKLPGVNLVPIGKPKSFAAEGQVSMCTQ